ncbi:MAG: DUF4911 domain-containing protein [Thermodesulfobacteriota bacterium]
MISHPGARLDALRLQVRPERIHFLKFILEGYDNMAILSTVDRNQGLVELKYPAELSDDLMLLLASMAGQINCVDPS